ncbi:hypothetical protein RB195_011015 [Necator americanus]|uniref:Uncharacterized protein n=1 Tax=Necator americanus TaxID=51031 RepID=A0ABR1D2R3_NECAM
MYEVLERIILERPIKHREETTRDEKADFRLGQSTFGVFIVRSVIEIWQWTLPVEFRHPRHYAKNSKELSADIVLAPSGRPLTDFENANDVVMFTARRETPSCCQACIKLAD